jgi:hypothetical protein
MYGASIGSLHVYKGGATTSPVTLLFQQTGNQVREWCSDDLVWISVKTVNFIFLFFILIILLFQQTGNEVRKWCSDDLVWISVKPVNFYLVRSEHVIWWDLAEWSERCASIPKIIGLNPSGGSDTLCSQRLESPRRAG